MNRMPRTNFSISTKRSKVLRVIACIISATMLGQTLIPAAAATKEFVGTVKSNHNAQVFLKNGISEHLTKELKSTDGSRLANTPFHFVSDMKTAIGPFSNQTSQSKKESTSVMSISLLDTHGNLARVVRDNEITSWKGELSARGISNERASQLHLWLGEWELAQNESPGIAQLHFKLARQMTSIASPVYGRSIFDDGLTDYYKGAYQLAAKVWKGLIAPENRLVGYDSRACAVWLHQASTSAAYHLERSQAGVPEPPQLDPLCGIAALASSIRGLGLQYDQKRIQSVCRVTGLGSSLKDLETAANKLGLKAIEVSADDKGLMALPKPIIAYVEHDHFVSVTKADNNGVTYLCSDCGAWPGGAATLTWKQWRMLDASVYTIITQNSSLVDRTLGQLPERIAFTGDLSRLKFPLYANNILSLALLRGHVYRTANGSGAICGGKHNPGRGHGPNPPKHGDPVNLVTGEEEYAPDPDITVYNPHGPAVSWRRVYGSLRSVGQGYPYGDNTYECNDFGVGWSQGYNVGVYDPTGGGTGPSNLKYVYFEDGSSFSFTASSAPASGAPVQCNVPNGQNCLVEWDSDSAQGHYTITLPDRTKWITRSANASACYQLSQISDRNGNSIYFNYGAPASLGNWPLLSNITNGPNNSGTQLLAIKRSTDGTGNVVAVTDCYGRSVYYHSQSFNNQNVPVSYTRSYQQLDYVSQIVPTGTPNAPFRNKFSYQTVNNGDTGVGLGGEKVVFLHTVVNPSPTGIGDSTFTINYDPTTEAVANTVDGNGNITTFTSVDASGASSYPSNYTKVSIAASVAPGTPVYSYTAGFNIDGNTTSMTDGAGSIVWRAAYNSTASPFDPSSTTDGNSHVTYYTYDQYRNVLTNQSPRPVTTTYFYDYSRFPMGELMKVTVASSTDQKTATNYTYYEPNGLVKTSSTPTPGTTGGYQVTTTYTYDSLGNVTKIQAPGNNASDTSTVTLNYTTDALYTQSASVGQPVLVTDSSNNSAIHLRYDVQGNVVSSTDATGNETDFNYNLANQRIVTLFPATGQSGPGRSYEVNNYLYIDGPLSNTQEYDERNSTTPVYPSGYAAIREVDYSYGQEEELLSVTGSTQPIVYSYDAHYRLLTNTDGNGHTTTYSYNPAGYLATVKRPNFNTGTGYDITQYTLYDNNGDATSRIDGRGQVTTYGYSDPENNLTSIQYSSASSLNVTIGYDNYGRIDRLSDGSAGTSTTPGINYLYDDNDQLNSVNTTYNGLPSKAITYTYYNNGQRRTMSTPAGVFSYYYDTNGNLKQLVNPFSEVSSWTYLTDGYMNSQTLGNGVSTTYTPNSLKLMMDLKTVKSDAVTTLSEYGAPSSMGYDGADNLKQVTSSLTSAPSYSGTKSYTYDAKNQLTLEGANSYVYDSGASIGAGNITSFKGTGISYNVDNQNSAYTYDGNGNPISFKGSTLSYDPENRLTGYGSILSAGYDAWGRRAWKQTSAGRIYFLYDGTQPVCEMSSSGSVAAVNTFGANGLLSRRVGSATTYYTFDMQGNVSQRLDQSQTVIASSMFDAYGNRSSTDGNITDPFSGYGAQWGYYTDWETGLELLTFRYYDPTNGTFIGRDPIDFDGGVNLYEYTDNNPINEIDDDGLAGRRGGGRRGGGRRGPGGNRRGSGRGRGSGRKPHPGKGNHGHGPKGGGGKGGGGGGKGGGGSNGGGSNGGGSNGGGSNGGGSNGGGSNGGGSNQTVINGGGDNVVNNTNVNINFGGGSNGGGNNGGSNNTQITNSHGNKVNNTNVNVNLPPTQDIIDDIIKGIIDNIGSGLPDVPPVLE